MEKGFETNNKKLEQPNNSSHDTQQSKKVKNHSTKYEKREEFKSLISQMIAISLISASVAGLGLAVHFGVKGIECSDAIKDFKAEEQDLLNLYKETDEEFKRQYNKDLAYLNSLYQKDIVNTTVYNRRLEQLNSDNYVKNFALSSSNEEIKQDLQDIADKISPYESKLNNNNIAICNSLLLTLFTARPGLKKLTFKVPESKDEEQEVQL